MPSGSWLSPLLLAAGRQDGDLIGVAVDHPRLQRLLPPDHADDVPTLPGLGGDAPRGPPPAGLGEVEACLWVVETRGADAQFVEQAAAVVAVRQPAQPPLAG